MSPCPSAWVLSRNPLTSSAIATGSAPSSESFPGPTEPFVSMPISYDRAFGGIDSAHPDPRATATTSATTPASDSINRQSANSSTARRCPTPKRRAARNRPSRLLPAHGVRLHRASLAAARPVRRNLRPELARQHLPFPPPDFDNRYYQAAPPISRSITRAAAKRSCSRT